MKAATRIKYNGKLYEPGQAITGLSKEDAERLIAAGAVEEGSTPEEKAAPAPKAKATEKK